MSLSLSRFDRIILAAVLALGLAIGAVSTVAARLGPSVDSVNTVSQMDGVSVNTRIAITFTQPMDHLSVQRHLRITPVAPGAVIWSGNELFFTPRHALAYSTTYTLQIGAARDTSGQPLARGLTYAFRTQSEHLLYLGTAGATRRRLVLTSVNGQREVVGSDDGLVTDFSVSPDRSLVVYTKRSAPGGRPDEIWLLSLADNTMQRVFAHPGWAISQPHLSPQDNAVVFLATDVRLCRKYYGCSIDQADRIVYLLDLSTHRAHMFLEGNSSPITNFITFSPSGQVAYTDAGSAVSLANPNGHGIQQIPAQGNSVVFAGFDSSGNRAVFVGQTPGSSGGDVLIYAHGKYLDVSYSIYDSATPSLSSAGDRIAYAAYRSEDGIEPVYGINVYDVRSRRTTRLTADRHWSDWAPTWSSDGRFVAFVRAAPQEAMYMGAGTVWVMRANGTAGHPLDGMGKDVQWVS